MERSCLAVEPNNGNSYDFLLMRLLPNGNPDPGFGSNGIITTDFNGNSDCIYSLVLLANGKILVSGSTNIGSSYFAAARYLSTGVPDITFGSAGKLSLGSGSRLDICYGMAITADSSIVMAGTHHSGTIDEYMFAKLDKHGNLDFTFGNQGLVYLQMTEAGDELNDVVITPAGKILAAGSGKNHQPVLIRLNANGSPDHDFGSQGIYSGNIGAAASSLKSLVLLSDSSMLACGFTKQSATGNTDFLLMKTLFDIGLATDEVDLAMQTSIYPNPTTDYLNLDLPLETGKPVEISIYNLSGSLLFQQKFEYSGFTEKIELPEGVKHGVFLLQISMDGNIYTKKFIVQ